MSVLIRVIAQLAMSSRFITVYNVVREGSVFSRVCLSTWGGGSPHVTTVNLLKTFSLEIPPGPVQTCSLCNVYIY